MSKLQTIVKVAGGGEANKEVREIFTVKIQW